MSWPPAHNLITLDGSWLIRPDPDDCGLDSQWWLQPGDSDQWLPVDLPCAWQSVLGADYHGVAWYWRQVEIPRNWRRGAEKPDQHLWLRFEAVATECQAWVNGVEVGRHAGDYVPFQFDITQAAEGADRIDIVIRVDELAAPPPDEPGGLQHGHITKGFHDVISLQHGGIWQPVHLARTGCLCAIPDGISVLSDCKTGSLQIEVGLEPVRRIEPGCIKARIEAGQYSIPSDWKTAVDVLPDATSISLRLRPGNPLHWSPERPELYVVRIDLFDGRRLSESHIIRVGFRQVEADGTKIRLNGTPLLIRGVLDWGHEPDHIAPAPTETEVRARFEQLREMGFNCVCLCMWYPPRYFFDIADELGMLIWQEHPVWQSPMDDEHIEEYKRLYAAHMRRDVNHPSVVIVSATCEHPSFHPEVADWWWNTARRVMPDRLLELQTAFFRWADLERTDLHDEHTYDNSNRWVDYLADVQHHLQSLPAKPFVMGETALFTSWPAVSEIDKRIGESGEKPWWLPRAFEHERALERQWATQYGEDVLTCFKAQSDRFHLLGRKFQIEQFRLYPNHAGVVMNHLRDVSQCQCGFMDDANHWRFQPEKCRGWLGPVAMILVTPDHRRGFTRSERVRQLTCQLAVSNFGGRRFADTVRVMAGAKATPPVSVPVLAFDCAAGEVQRVEFPLMLPMVKQPTWFQMFTESDNAAMNWWDLWVFPPADEVLPDGIVRMTGLPFAKADGEPDEEERAYSRGYGLEVRNWQCILPDPAVLVPTLTPWAVDDPLVGEAKVVLTHKLTARLVDFLEGGGRVVLLASKTAGGLGTRYEWLFGQVPLIIEEGPLAKGDSAWITDLLGYDLTRRYCRVMPVEDLGIADQVDPLIRLVYTHDQKDRVRFFDLLFQARVGEGLLIVSSLDHSEGAGQYVLRRILNYAAGDESTARGALDPVLLREWTVEAAVK
ncbi:MAG: hypothetical protein JSV91_00200 [Phycisphaerales bacterium]|nr:MAG: hypothetical protein JSV91_00200 [Phycisphaerales bacterium]